MKVKFIPQNIEIEVGPNKTLLQYATENGIEIKSICKGVPSCAECRIRLVDGESNVLPPNKAELELIGTNWRIDSRRLACQIHCYGDITVDMTEQLERQANQTKKVRGYRSNKQAETQAVQDTMILTEKPELRNERGEDSAHADRKPSQGRQEQGRQQQGKSGSEKRGQGGKQSHSGPSSSQGKQGRPQQPSQQRPSPASQKSQNRPPVSAGAQRSGGDSFALSEALGAGAGDASPNETGSSPQQPRQGRSRRGSRRGGRGGGGGGGASSNGPRGQGPRGGGGGNGGNGGGGSGSGPRG
jgi:ferredoxin